MPFQRVHQFCLQKTQTQSTISRSAARPLTVKTQLDSDRPPTHLAHSEVQSLEQAARFGHHFANIPVHPPDTQASVSVQRKQVTDDQPVPAAEQRPNYTGLPDRLKAGVEHLSGFSLDNVQVHYNSDKPAQLNALAYAQGTDIHIAPGQEQHLPHEAWHIVQQAQGRVKPTIQMKGAVQISDDEGLEHEADVMGAQALSVGQRVESVDVDGTVATPNHFVKKVTRSLANTTVTGVAQRIKCDVSQNSRTVGSSPQIGRGGVGGVSHAEQKAWEDAGALAIQPGDIIKFHVDGPICQDCTLWFENTIYPIVNRARATLMVNVIYNEPGGSQYYGTIQVTGPGTVWGKVSERGYYGDGGRTGDREVVGALRSAMGRL